MKRLLAILFSVTLVWAQGVPLVCAQAATTAAGSSGCSCCCCGKACSCMNQTAPRSQPQPAAPAPTVSQSGQLLLLAPATVAFVLPQSSTSAISSPTSLLRRPAAPALYQQNCTLLL